MIVPRCARARRVPIIGELVPALTLSIIALDNPCLWESLKSLAALGHNSLYEALQCFTGLNLWITNYRSVRNSRCRVWCFTPLACRLLTALAYAYNDNREEMNALI